MLYKGSLELYKNETFIENPHMATPFEKYLKYSDYFLFSPTKGLIKVECTSQFKNIKDVFRYFEFEKKFIETIPIHASFDEIKGWLLLYDYWVCKKEKDYIPSKTL